VHWNNFVLIKYCADHIRPSVCPSVTQYQKVMRWSYFHEIRYSSSVLKWYQASERFVKSHSLPAALYWKELKNFYLRLPYFLMDLCELCTENLHIMLLCVYHINENRSSGSHTVVQGVNEKNKIFAHIF